MGKLKGQTVHKKAIKKEKECFVYKDPITN